jgi:monothiol glutaredoxin
MENKIKESIENEIAANDVVLFMKGSKNFPQCGFSSLVVQILTKLGVKFKDINVLESNDLREGIKAFSNWPTIPQLYIKGEFVGGCDIVKESYQTGELARLLENCAKS